MLWKPDLMSSVVRTLPPCSYVSTAMQSGTGCTAGLMRPLACTKFAHSLHAPFLGTRTTLETNVGSGSRPRFTRLSLPISQSLSNFWRSHSAASGGAQGAGAARKVWGPAP